MTTTDDAIQRLVDIEDIKQLKAKYWRCLDTKDWEGYRSTLADDLSFESDTTHRTDGADVFVALLQDALAGSVTVHRGHASEIAITGPDTATGIWSFTDWIDRAPGVAGDTFKGYGHYHDDYVRTPEGWKIHRSVITRLRIDLLEATG